MVQHANSHLETLRQAADLCGLRLRGGFRVLPDDGVPPLPDGRLATSVVLLGAVGGSLWPAFSSSPEYTDGEANPLDRWSRRVIDRLAADLGAAALFPFGGPPWLPFQRWALRAEPVAPSPIGLLIHPRYGLWHSYRGALAFAEPLEVPPREELPCPCDSCTDRPCLSACPVGAFTGERYDVQRCVAQLSVPAGEACMQAACLARSACPVAPLLAYDVAQARFHMGAFLAAQRGERKSRETA